MHVNTSTSLTVKRATLIRFKTKILSRNPVGGAQTIRLHHFKIITHTTKQFPGRCKTGTRFKCIHGGTTTRRYDDYSSNEIRIVRPTYRIINPLSLYDSGRTLPPGELREELGYGLERALPVEHFTVRNLRGRVM
ncbi:hypothetical protein QE152_g26549 [Popillia japonica]|uniref:Uncharacterized protein n=1 Tax=Popillia japonica TaxID=7064 RepID=A0AAW1JXW8_POPJA